MEEKIAQTANIVKEAVVIGDVTIGDGSCVLFHAVIRGDDDRIEIGRCTNIQDNCTVHYRKSCDCGTQCGDPWLYDRGRQPDRNGICYPEPREDRQGVSDRRGEPCAGGTGDSGWESGCRQPGEDKADAYASGEGKTV